jgi:hypothetical protein
VRYDLVTRVPDGRHENANSFGRAKTKKSTGRRTPKEKDNIKMDLENTGSNGGDPYDMAQERDY